MTVVFYYYLLFTIGLRSIGRREGCGTAENIDGVQGKLGWCGSAALGCLVFVFFLIIQLFVVFDFDIFRMHVCM